MFTPSCMPTNIAIVIKAPISMLTIHLPISFLKHLIPYPCNYYYWSYNKDSIYNDIK